MKAFVIKILVLHACFVLGMAAALAPGDGYAQTSALTLIANSEGAPTDMHFEKMQHIFKAHHQRWSNGTKIALAMVKSPNPISNVVADKVYGMDVDGVKKYWVQIVFRGKASTPKYFDTEEEVQQYVAATPGAIGIVGASPSGGGARVVKVDGKHAW